MTARFHLDPEKDLLVGEVSNVVTAEEVIDALADVTRQTGGVALGKNVLFVVDDSTQAYSMDMAALIRLKDALGDLVRTYRPDRQVRSALVASGARANPILKLWEAIVELHADIGSSTRAFRSESQALKWLSSPETERPPPGR